MARRKRADADDAEATEKPKKSSDPKERLAATVAGLKQRYPGRVLRGSEYTMAWMMRRIPFHIPDLDIATNGGVPAGGMTMLVGKPGEGKNFLLNRLIISLQKTYGDACAVACIGTELPYDKTQGRAQGVKVALSNAEIAQLDKESRELHGRTLSPEEVADLKTQVGTFIVVPPSTAEEAFNIAVDLVRSGDFHLVALDSFGSILPDSEVDKSFEEATKVGGPSGLNTQLMRKLSQAFAPDDEGNPNLTVFVGINQVRDNLKAQSFQKQTKESGGWSLQHGRFLTIEIARTEWIKSKKGQRIGKVIKWEITKQKAGGHEGYDGEYEYIFDKCDINLGELLLRLGVEYGLITKTKNTYTYCGLTLGVGVANAGEAIADTPDLRDELYTAIMVAADVALVP